MNILIVNFDNCYNHGGVLQCWALQQLLKSMGHSVVKADLPQPTKYPQNKIRLIWNVIKRIRRKYLIGDKYIEIFKEFQDNNFIYIPHKKIIHFSKLHIITYIVNSMYDIPKDTFDAVIVGSDQVWRRRYASGHKLLSENSACDNAFLSFTKDWHCKRIAYAASVGVDYWEYTEKETEILKELIKNFSAISVREDSAINLLHEHLDSEIKIEHVLDPTLLIQKTEYIKLFQEIKETDHTGEILVYILDQEKAKDNIVQYVKQKMQLNTFNANNPLYFQFNLPPQKRIQTSITSWLRGFHDAKIIITDSFHACVFSIIFEKPFYVILNETRGTTRIMSLLKIFNLTNRIVHSTEDIKHIDNNIDWVTIREIEKKWQKKSIDFLQNALK